MNKEFRKLVMTKEFWKDIPEEYQWVAVDGCDGMVFVHKNEPSLGTQGGLYTSECFGSGGIKHITKLEDFPTEPDKLSRKECLVKTNSNQYRLVIETVAGTTHFCDPFECSEERFEEMNEEAMTVQVNTLIVTIGGKDVRFQMSNIICMYFEEV